MTVIGQHGQSRNYGISSAYIYNINYLLTLILHSTCCLPHCYLAYINNLLIYCTYIICPYNALPSPLVQAYLLSLPSTYSPPLYVLYASC